MSIVKNIPRIELINLPTPLNELKNLSTVLGGPRIFVKREDLTGLAMGGNKSRKLEYVMADTRAKGYDTIISSAGSQSNWCLQVAAACRKLGMECAFVHFSGVHPEIQGNLLLHKILGSTNIILEGTLKKDSSKHVKTGAYASDLKSVLNQLVEEFRQKGRKPVIQDVANPLEHCNLLGSAAYVQMVEELQGQLSNQNIEANYLVLPQGSGSTHGGILLGVRALNLPLKVIGMSVSRPAPEGIQNVAGNFNATAKLLGLNISIAPEEVVDYDGYIGEGYGAVTEKTLEAIRLVARTEGFFLDPVYTGKAMSGLIDLIRKGKFSSKDTIVFVHTGGIPAIFAYQKEFAV